MKTTLLATAVAVTMTAGIASAEDTPMGDISLSGSLSYENNSTTDVAETEFTVQADAGNMFVGATVTNADNTAGNSKEYFIGMNADLTDNLSSSVTYTRYADVADNMDSDITIGVSTMVGTLDVSGEYTYGLDDLDNSYELGVAKDLGAVTVAYTYEDGENTTETQTLGASMALGSFDMYAERNITDDETTVGLSVAF